MPSEKQRVDIIDGLRGVAVLAVVAHHFYYRFGPPVMESGIYPYDSIAVFEYGGLGVNLFFIISGFVIFDSLEQSNSIPSFLVRRYFRLLPAMVLCAIITYFVTIAHESNSLIFHQATPLNLLFSFTFIHPDVWNLVLDRNDVKFVDGTYWSLWTEVIFYIAAALVYFSFVRKDFLKKWLIVVLALQVLRAVASPHFTSLAPSFATDVLDKVYVLYLFLDMSYWIYFTAGIFFYALFKGRRPGVFEWVGAAILVALQLYYIKQAESRYVFLLILLVFTVLVRRPGWLGFLKWRPLVLIGLISYPLYLIHENVGVLLVNDLATLIGSSWIRGLVPLVIAAILVLFCYLVFVYYERPVIRYLKSKFLPET